MRFTEEQVKRARETPIHGILGLKMRRAKIKCPFHSDSTASLQIYPDSSFYCFGCTKHGANSIDFLTELGYSFYDAVKYLTGEGDHDII